MPDVLLEVRNLSVHFPTRSGVVKAVDGLDLTLYRNKTMCVVGESGSGKSMTASAILQLLKKPGRIAGGEILFHHKNGRVVDLAKLKANSEEMRQIRGGHIAMIFQEPMTSMSPVHTIGDQVSEMILLHEKVSKAEAKARTIRLFGRVGIPDPEARYDIYPFMLSGGMRQRVMIAMALSCNPELLIADEPTTALDVTMQANVLGLMQEVQKEFGISIMLITHDFGVVAEVADDVSVMYLGRTVEQGEVHDIFRAPKHPYTRALLNSIPKLDAIPGHRLTQIEGMVPSPFNRPSGCPFQSRCPDRIADPCARECPELLDAGTSRARCYQYDPAYAALWQPALAEVAK
ncbi:MAG: dipeptide/oligopeptide/nickel transporter ATP-binding protein [Devosia sp.]|uniref:ABC transporter ATP-binding protein n=1 Tax=Devosia sp. TaxID=1871048 RepID=UPI00260C8D46|nr:ABC transporter ATP-binding protein [Devosia sp.]MDB5530705.1 dipeptide/oligopeptide/nickel transporter ATP-binding protein [Devosia sp.]